MSLTHVAIRNKRVIFLIGLDRDDVDHLIGDDVIYLESKVDNLPDIAIFAGENEADLLSALAEMSKNHD